MDTLQQLKSELASEYQITHHRAQLGVYYRRNGIPLPARYGPSADS